MAAAQPAELKSKVVAVVAEILEVDPAEVPEDKPLMEVFDIDSLDLVDMVVGIEKQFGIRFPKEEAGRIRSVDEAVERLEVALARAGA